MCKLLGLSVAYFFYIPNLQYAISRGLEARTPEQSLIVGSAKLDLQFAVTIE